MNLVDVAHLDATYFGLPSLPAKHTMNQPWPLPKDQLKLNSSLMEDNIIVYIPFR